ncbi:MAG: 30S ribosomal protein S30e [Candidatus Bathyarchaeota archaeon]|nr:30S ribosomal protein S30e [Candidatus Bathyarchaeota archaeon]
MPTHGSLTKAGKVRHGTPNIPSTRRKRPSPKSRNRRNYRKRVVFGTKIGQYWSGSRRRRRR